MLCLCVTCRGGDIIMGLSCMIIVMALKVGLCVCVGGGGGGICVCRCVCRCWMPSIIAASAQY